MAAPKSPFPADDSTDVEPYTMHVSSRYLDLTKKKLELTRMPREVPAIADDQWLMGTPKAALEPLIDYWLESYDWRSQEAIFNSTLRQYRTRIKHPSPTSASVDPNLDIDIEAAAADLGSQPEELRIHFLHHRSESPTAIPLLYCHTWPGSFLEMSRCIDALVNPSESNPRQKVSGQVYRDRIAFHVVVPSTPGFAFSDASTRPDFDLRDTADMFARLMKRLGYDRFVVWGDGWGFKVARFLALRHNSKVAAVYTSHAADLPAPQALKHKDAWFKYQIARITGARFPWLSFGYTTSDFGAADLNLADVTATQPDSSHRKDGDVELAHRIKSPGKGEGYEDASARRTTPKCDLPAFVLSKRPQTIAYGLCDSPAGLLALLMDVLKPAITHTVPKPLASRSQTRHRSATVLQHRMSTITESIPTQPTFTPADILNWAMMYWLPGPEAGLRWLAAVEKDDCFVEYSDVPLGMSWFSSVNVPGNASTGALRSARSLERLFSRAPTTHDKLDSSASASTTPTHDPTTIKSPIWAAAFQNLKWVKRRREELSCGVPAWEKSSEVVDDVREFFESGRNQGWLGL